MIKLTAPQMTILASACEREDGLLVRPAALKSAAALKIAEKLFENGLVREQLAKGDMPIWRKDEQGKTFSLKILKAGRALVKVPDTGPKAAGEKIAAATPQSGSNVAAATKVEAAGLTMAADKSRGLKRKLVLALLQRQEGASIGDLMTATGWLPHTTRAALSGLRKLDWTLERFRDAEFTTRYRITDATNAVALSGASDPRALHAGAAAAAGGGSSARAPA